MTLTDREKWLMLQAWSQGRDEFDSWLGDHGEHLACEAPPGPDQPCRCADLEGKLRRLSYMAHNTPATVDQANEMAKEAMEILAEFKGE